MRAGAACTETCKASDADKIALPLFVSAHALGNAHDPSNFLVIAASTQKVDKPIRRVEHLQSDKATSRDQSSIRGEGRVKGSEGARPSPAASARMQTSAHRGSSGAKAAAAAAVAAAAAAAAAASAAVGGGGGNAVRIIA